MPLFAVHAIDVPGTLQRRIDRYSDHRAFVEDQEAQGVKVILSGPLQSDDGGLMTGSLFVLEAKDRAAVDAFVANDPFMVTGIWDQVRVDRFHPRKGPLREDV